MCQYLSQVGTHWPLYQLYESHEMTRYCILSTVVKKNWYNFET